MAVKRPLDDLALGSPLKAPKMEPHENEPRETHSVPQSILSPEHRAEKLRRLESHHRRESSADAARQSGFALPPQLNTFLGLAGGQGGFNPALLAQQGLMPPGLQSALLAQLSGSPHASQLHSLLAQQQQQQQQLLQQQQQQQQQQRTPPQPPKPTPPSSAPSTSHLPSPSTNSTTNHKKSGKWCAMHVKIAWDIYKQESAKKKQAKHPPVSASTSTSKEPNGGSVNGSEMSVIASTGVSPSQRKSLEKAGTPMSRTESRTESRPSAGPTLNGAQTTTTQRGIPGFPYPPASLAQLTSMAPSLGAYPGSSRGFPGHPMFDLGMPSTSSHLSFPGLHLGLFPGHSAPGFSHLPANLYTSMAPTQPASHNGSSHSQLQLAPEFQGLRLPKTTTADHSPSSIHSSFPIPTSLYSAIQQQQQQQHQQQQQQHHQQQQQQQSAPGVFNPMDPYGIMAARQRQMDMISMTQRDEVLRRQQAALLGAVAGGRGVYGNPASLDGAGALSGLLEQELMARQRLLQSGFGSGPPSGLPHSFPSLHPGIDPAALLASRPPFPGPPHPSSITQNPYAVSSTHGSNGKLPSHHTFSATLEQLARHKRESLPSSVPSSFQNSVSTSTFPNPLLPPSSSSNPPQT